ncbi:anthrone oxygenase family protein [Yoonia sediminilitoris]|uniref:Putative membrane protein n=1 Tax=Yoonia sediminilitoris TaxID=1286148 RepID=A0A2T6KM81_9RHOB|nr:anthrone oxygenase family protein [Yoonia sediminilitoris]PUB17328.1 putative membrane protein [Yoonia sediminilitoris]RCW97623.1 putative membrane protein [Yoonia sediminilitoris]
MSIAFFFLFQFAILAYALLGGVFLAFSDFIMRSLAMTGGHGGIEAMQVINREVFRWVFMALFLGMAAASLIVAGYGAFGLSGPAGTLVMMAGLVYLVGCFGVTVFFNVPMNEALAGMDISSGTTRDYWAQTYVPRWTFWNSVRTTACAASAALLLFGLLWMTQSQTQSA